MAAEFSPIRIRTFTKSEINQVYPETAYPRVTFIPTINGALPECLEPQQCSKYIYMDFPSESNKKNFLQSLISTDEFATKQIRDPFSSGISLDQRYDNDVLGDRRIEPLVFTFTVNGSPQEIESCTYITNFNTAKKAYDYTQHIWGAYYELSQTHDAAAAVHTSSSQHSSSHPAVKPASSWSSQPPAGLLTLPPQASRAHIPAAAASASAAIAPLLPPTPQQPTSSAPTKSSLVSAFRAALPDFLITEDRWDRFFHHLDAANYQPHIFVYMIDGAGPEDLEASVMIHYVHLEDPEKARKYYAALTGDCNLWSQSPQSLTDLLSYSPTYNNRIINKSPGPVAFIFSGFQGTAHTSNFKALSGALLHMGSLMERHNRFVKEHDLLQIITTGSKATNEHGPDILVRTNQKVSSVKNAAGYAAFFYPPITLLSPASLLNSHVAQFSNAVSASTVSATLQQAPSPTPTPLSHHSSTSTSASTVSATPQQAPSPAPTPLSSPSVPTGNSSTASVSVTPQQPPSSAPNPLNSSLSVPTGNSSTASVTPQQAPSPAPNPPSHSSAPTSASVASATPQQAPSRSYSAALTGNRNAAAALQPSSQGPRGPKKRPNQRTRRRQLQAQKKPNKS